MKLSGRNKLSSSSSANLTVNYEFLSHVQTFIESKAKEEAHKPSTYYTPSALSCVRQMYYKRTNTPMDESLDLYSNIGMADTGTRRHEAIQDVLIYMTNKKSRFLYIDVERYILERQKRGKCLTLEVKGKHGSETSVVDRNRNVSFRVDGIIYDRKTKEFYLFEFKNQISFKASKKSSVDEGHKNQVYCYCALLELDKALVLYENRDNCELFCPEMLEVTDYNKASILKKIDDCEKYVNEGKVPPVSSDISKSVCNYCKYKTACKRDCLNANGGVSYGSSKTHTAS